MSRAKIVLALIASLGTVSTAFAVDPAATDLQAQLNWRATFGGASRHVEAGYGLTVGYRAAPDAPSAQILQLDVSDRAALARLVGLPLLERTYRVEQTETETVVTTDAPVATEQPWYAQSWVYWAAGGLAAAAALGGSGSHNSQCDDCGNTNSSNSNQNGTTGVSSNGSGGTEAGCVNGQCAVTCTSTTDPKTCQPGLVTVRRSRLEEVLDHERELWLDAEAGHMGDLIAR